MEKEKVIYFDMDGTIADLYGYNGWLKELRAASCKPYEGAAPLVRMQLLARYLNKLQRNGWKLGIVSWLSKGSTKEYEVAVTKAKMKWLKVHLKSVQWNEMHFVSYGTPKEETVQFPKGILFDDEEKNRINWKGTAYDEKNIIEVLKAIAQQSPFGFDV